jgi:5-methylcytosine-specific restriction endonuclease McrA
MTADGHPVLRWTTVPADEYGPLAAEARAVFGRHVPPADTVDLALLEVDGLDRPAVTVRPTPVRPDERLVVTGFPQAHPLAAQGEVTGTRAGHLAVTVLLGKGVSGGPALDADHRLAGIASFRPAADHRLHLVGPELVAEFLARAGARLDRGEPDTGAAPTRRPVTPGPDELGLDEPTPRPDPSEPEPGPRPDPTEPEPGPRPDATEPGPTGRSAAPDPIEPAPGFDRVRGPGGMSVLQAPELGGHPAGLLDRAVQVIRPDGGRGSGVILWLAGDGLVLTNRHVVGDADEVTVRVRSGPVTMPVRGRVLPRPGAAAVADRLVALGATAGLTGDELRRAAAHLDLALIELDRPRFGDLTLKPIELAGWPGPGRPVTTVGHSSGDVPLVVDGELRHLETDGDLLATAGLSATGPRWLDAPVLTRDGIVISRLNVHAAGDRWVGPGGSGGPITVPGAELAGRPAPLVGLHEGRHPGDGPGDHPSYQRALPGPVIRAWLEATGEIEPDGPVAGPIRPLVRLGTGPAGPDSAPEVGARKPHGSGLTGRRIAAGLHGARLSPASRRAAATQARQRADLPKGFRREAWYLRRWPLALAELLEGRRDGPVLTELADQAERVLGRRPVLPEVRFHLLDAPIPDAVTGLAADAGYRRDHGVLRIYASWPDWAAGVLHELVEAEFARWAGLDRHQAHTVAVLAERALAGQVHRTRSWLTRRAIGELNHLAAHHRDVLLAQSGGFPGQLAHLHQKFAGHPGWEALAVRYAQRYHHAATVRARQLPRRWAAPRGPPRVRRPVIKLGSAGGPTGGHPFSAEVIAAAKAEDPTATCVFCARPGTGTQVDHVIPRARGGNATLANAQLACPHCNQSKGDQDYPLHAPVGYRGSWPPRHWPARATGGPGSRSPRSDTPRPSWRKPHGSDLDERRDLAGAARGDELDPVTRRVWAGLIERAAVRVPAPEGFADRYAVLRRWLSRTAQTLRDGHPVDPTVPVGPLRLHRLANPVPDAGLGLAADAVTRPGPGGSTLVFATDHIGAHHELTETWWAAADGIPAPARHILATLAERATAAPPGDPGSWLTARAVAELDHLAEHNPTSLWRLIDEYPLVIAHLERVFAELPVWRPLVLHYARTFHRAALARVGDPPTARDVSAPEFPVLTREPPPTGPGPGRRWLWPLASTDPVEPDKPP